MKYSVEISRSAARDLRKVPEPYHTKIVGALQALENEPRPHGCKKLLGGFDLYRIRVGVYRVIYEITDKIKLVVIERIADRKDVYR